MTKIDIPELLKDGFAKELNCSIFKSIKAFPFVNPDGKLLLTMPSSYSDAFVSFILSLYKLYHDFGFQLPDIFLPSERQHINNIGKLRTLIAHGQISPKKNISLIYLLKNYMPSNTNKAVWPDFFDNLYESDWQEAVLAITYEANCVYNKLKKYAEGELSIDAFTFKYALEKALNMKIYKEVYNLIVSEQFNGDFEKVKNIIVSDPALTTKKESNDKLVDRWLADKKRSWTHNIIETKIDTWTNPEDLITSIKEEISTSISALSVQKSRTAFNIFDYM